MCGLAGILNFSAQVRPEINLLKKMIANLEHRGPDGFGYHVDENIGLSHARLSIIDIVGGQQPIHNEDKTTWVVFNGEIFNYIELRIDLENEGHIFYTHSDTEVIVHSYEQYGDDFVNHLNGQFSIALWDSKKKRLLLVRDRVGIHPLFYSQQNGRLIFSSEVKAMLPAFASSPRLNISALDQIFTFWAVSPPDTIFEDVYQVQPGELIAVDNSGLRKTKYWEWDYPTNNLYHKETESEQAEKLHELLLEATKLRLRSDVPVGAYLSGGLDSSALTSLISQQGAKLRTFSIGFEDSHYDEGIYQQQMIQYLATDHTNIRCSNDDIGRAFEKTIWHTETPVLRTAPVPMMLLSGLVKSNGYKVVLTGEGADEVLGGYDIFKEGKIRSFWAKNPDSNIRPLLLKRLYPYLDMSSKQGQSYLEAFFGVGLREPDAPHFSHLPRWTTTSSCKVFFSDGIKNQLKNNAVDNLMGTWPATINQWHNFNKAQYIEAKTLMSGYLLCSQGDRMLMANSVEGRFPFLDHHVIEFANKIHPNLKMKVLNEKYILKKAMKNYLPESIIKRYKQPYRAPDIPAFITSGSAEYTNDLLSRDMIDKYGYFDGKKVEYFMKKVRQGRAIGAKDNMAFVGMLSTQIWHQLFIENFNNSNPTY